MALGIVTGEMARLCFFALYFIRSQEEARRLALPRIPVAVRASFAMASYVVPALVLAVLLAPSFAPPLSFLWPWFLGLPILVLAGAAALSLLPRVHVRRDGTSEPRAVWMKGLRRAFDQHDAHYQVGGWDRRLKPHNTQLYEAAERGDTEAVGSLLSKGANPDELNQLGWTALMMAVANGHKATALTLLESGANPNITNLIGRSPLMFAARYGDVDLVAQLLRNGAQVDLNESPDPNALCSAALEGHVQVVRLLLEAGADPSVQARTGLTAQQAAELAGHGEIAALLRNARLERERRQGRNQTP